MQAAGMYKSGQWPRRASGPCIQEGQVLPAAASEVGCERNAREEYISVYLRGLVLLGLEMVDGSSKWQEDADMRFVSFRFLE
jgi:hypothetical protein